MAGRRQPARRTLHGAPAELGELDWQPASVPGTAAGVAARRRRAGAPATCMTSTPRTGGSGPASRPGRRAPASRCCSQLDGIATVAEVFLNGVRGRWRANRCSPPTRSTSARCCRRTATSWRSAAGRWRRCCGCGASRGRAGGPGWSTAACASSARCCSAARPASRPGPPRSAPGGRCWLERRAGVAVEDLALRPRLEGDDGVLSVLATLQRARRRGPRGRHGRAVGSLRQLRGGADDGRDLRRRPRLAASYGCPRSRAGGRTPTASPPCTTSGCASRRAAAPARSRRAGSASALWWRVPDPTTIPRPTVSTCTSTAFASSPAAPSGPRSTRSAWRRRSSSCAAPWSRSATAG